MIAAEPTGRGQRALSLVVTLTFVCTNVIGVLPASAAAAATVASAPVPLDVPTYEDWRTENPSAVQSASNSSMGVTRGEFSVDGSGRASYVVPIEVVPGTGAFQPNLWLEYGSEAGNGLLGAGFTIGGLSEITRCPQTLAEDGVVRGVKLDQKDRYCLGGAKLVLVSGAYGADGAEYRTLPDQQLRIRSYGGSPNSGPSYFVVETPEGVRQYFGGTPEGASDIVKIVSPIYGTDHFSWPLLEARDASNNVIEYDWTQTSTVSGESERWISNINYGRQGDLDRRVHFVVDTRPDKTYGFRFGAPWQQTKRMKLIEVEKKVNSNWLLARSYDFTYVAEAATGVSLLNAMTKCGTVNHQCERPTKFGWQHGTASFANGVKQSASLPGSSGVQVMTGDMNGDGRTDYVYAGGLQWRYVLSQATPPLAAPSDHYQPAEGYGSLQSGIASKAYLLDYNLDGRTDLLERIEYQLWNPPPPWNPQLSKVQGAFSVVQSTTGFTGSLNQLNNAAGAMFGDFDGDGLQDNLEARNDPSDLKWYYWLRLRSGTVNESLDINQSGTGTSTPHDTEAFAGANIATPVPIGREPGEIEIVDIDGDGRDELLYPKTVSGTTVHIVARSLVPNSSDATINDTGLPEAVAGYDNKWMDLNGDGLIDLLTNGNGVQGGPGAQLYYALNTGRGFTALQPAGVTQPLLSFRAAKAIDVDGDGRDEVVMAIQVGSHLTGLQILRSEVAASGELTFQISKPLELTFDAMFDAGVNELGNQGLRIVDADGDGLQDLLVFVRGGTTLPGVYLFEHTGQSPALLRKVTEGLAPTPTVEIAYAPITDPAVHSRANCDRWQWRSCAFGAGKFVVNSVRRDLGLNSSFAPAGHAPGQWVSKYFYTNGRYDRFSGGGFAGFDEQLVTSYAKVYDEPQLGRTQITRRFYDQRKTAPGHAPRLIQQWSTTRLADDGQGERIAWERTRFSWDQMSVGPTYFDVINKTIVDYYEVPATALTCAGAASNCLAVLSPESASSQVASYSPLQFAMTTVTSRDNYGNVKEQTTKHGSSLPDDWTIVTATPAVDTGAWLVQRPGSITVTEIARDALTQDLRTQSRSTSFTYRPSAPGVNATLPETITYSSQGDPSLTTRYVYTSAGNLERITATSSDASDAPRESVYAYDPEGYPYAIRSGFNSNTSYLRFNPVTGQLQVAVDQNGVRADFTYDTLGRLLKVKGLQKPPAALGVEQRFAYSYQSAGGESLMQLEASDDTGAVGRRLFDRGGRAVRASFKGFDGVMREQRKTFDVYGQVVQATTYKRQGTADVNVLTYSYDNLDRLVKVIEPAAATGPVMRSWRYEGASTRYTDSRGNQKRTTRDVRGRTTEAIDALNDPSKQVKRRYGYAPFGRLATTQLEDVPNVLSTRSTYAYDSWGNLLSRSDAERGTSTYIYNAFDEPVTISDASGREYSLEHDVLGRLLSEEVMQLGAQQSKVRTSRSVYTYDTIEGTNPRTTYGALLRAQFTDDRAGGALHTSDYIYDALGRTATREYTLPSDVAPGTLETLRFKTGYDGFGRVKTQEFPLIQGLAQSTQITYDYAPASSSNGRLKSVNAYEQLITDGAPRSTLLWTAQASDPQDILNDYVLGSMRTLDTFDWNGRLLKTQVKENGLEDQSNLLLATLRYAYDGEGNVIERTDELQPGGPVTEYFAYDSMNRIAGLSLQKANLETAPDDSFSYDKLGSLTQSKRRGSYTFNPAKPTQVTNVSGSKLAANGTYKYDVLGRQTERPDGTVSYNDCNLPSAFTPSAGSTRAPASFLYDAQCSRYRRTTGTESVTYAEDYERHFDRQSGDIEHRLQVGGATLRYRQRGTALAKASTLYTSGDALGSTSLVVENELEGSGGTKTNILERRSYDVFGERRNLDWKSPDVYAGVQPDVLDQGYTGHLQDFDTGMIYMRGRMYDSQLARFTTPDPFVDGANSTQRWNRYAYVSQNPLKYTDPSGFGCEKQGCPDEKKKQEDNGKGGTYVERFRGFFEGTVYGSIKDFGQSAVSTIGDGVAGVIGDVGSGIGSGFKAIGGLFGGGGGKGGGNNEPVGTSHPGGSGGLQVNDGPSPQSLEEAFNDRLNKIERDQQKAREGQLNSQGSDPSQKNMLGTVRGNSGPSAGALGNAGTLGNMGAQTAGGGPGALLVLTLAAAVAIVEYLLLSKKDDGAKPPAAPAPPAEAKPKADPKVEPPKTPNETTKDLEEARKKLAEGIREKIRAEDEGAKVGKDVGKSILEQLQKIRQIKEGKPPYPPVPPPPVTPKQRGRTK